MCSSLPYAAKRTRNGSRNVFTGIVEEIGTVSSVTADGDNVVFRIEAPLVVTDAVHGA